MSQEHPSSEISASMLSDANTQSRQIVVETHISGKGCNRVLMLDEEPESFSQDKYNNAICLVKRKNDEKLQPDLVAYWANEKGIWESHEIEKQHEDFLRKIFVAQKQNTILKTDKQFSEIASKCGYTPVKTHRATATAGNANNVPPSKVQAVRNYQKNRLQQGLSVDAQFTNANVNEYHVNLLNQEHAISPEVEGKTATSLSDLPAIEATEPQITWYFSGENELSTLSIQVGTSLRQEDFVRLRLPAHTILLSEKRLKPAAHIKLYNQLSNYLTPVKKDTNGNRIILSGAPGLGKSYCAQHYLYYAAPKRHQLVAWLSGTTLDTFLRDWQRLADQFRRIDSDLSQMDNNTAIHTWCEQKLGQWLLVIDDVNIEATELEQYLPRQGGHVLLTTRHPDYALSHTEKLHFLPLDPQDSRSLVEAYFGRYWSDTGYAAEEAQAFEQLLAVMAGYPVALAQAALVICKKGISFARFMAQFQDATTRIHLLQDTVFGELRPQQTVTQCWLENRRHLLTILQAILPEVASDDVEKGLSAFISALIKSGEAFDFSHHTTHIVKTDDLIRDDLLIIAYPQKILSAYQTYLPTYLPIRFDVTENSWRLTSMGLAVLQLSMNMTFAPSFSLPVHGEKTAEEDLSESNKTGDPISIPQKEPTRPIAVKFSLHDGSRVGDIEIAVQTENYQQRQAKLKSGWKLPRPNLNFIPREKLTQELAQKLPVEAEKAETQQILLTTAVTGMGGVGKTELARHFITQHQQSKRYSYRFWLDASTPSRLYSEYRELALYLHLIEREPYIADEAMLKQLKKWLSINKGWLLVLDNADQYNNIESLVPEVGGCVVVTTRDKRPGTLSKERVVEVPVLAPEEAFNWLCQLAHRPVEMLTETEKEAVKNLLYKLGYLPLAIAQAAAYLRANPDVTIATYLAQFVTLLSDKTLAEGEAVEGDMYSRLVVSSTWNISLQEIKKNIAHPELADRLLGACAYLAPRNIPLSILELWFKQKDQNEDPIANYWLDEYVGQLLRYSLVDRDSLTATLSIHSLLQEVIRLKDKTILLPEKIFPERLQSLAILLLYLYPYEKQLVDYDKARTLLPHLEAVSHHISPLLINSLVREGEYEETPDHWQGALLNVISDFHLDVSGNAQQAINYSQKAMGVRLKIYGEWHPGVAAAYNNLGMAYKWLGDAVTARDYCQKALVIQLKLHGDMHPAVAKSYGNLGAIYRALGDIVQALNYQKKALAINLKIYPDIHPGVMRSYINLGSAYQASGESAQARDYYQKALAIGLKVYGDMHPYVAINYNNLGEAHRMLGDVPQARDCHQKALSVRLKIYGDMHPEVAQSYNNLGKAYQALGNAVTAQEHYKKALNIYLEVYGELHPEVATSYGNVGTSYCELGNAAQAPDCFKKALSILLKVYGEVHPEVATSYNNLGVTYGTLGDSLQELDYHQKALKVRREVYKIYNEVHSDVAESYNNIGTVYQTLGKATQALDHHKKALAILKQIYGEVHPRIATSYGNLGTTCKMLGDAVQALDHHQKALAILKQIYGEVHPHVATTYNNLGVTYRALGNVAQMLNYLEKALAIFRQIYGDMHPSVAASYFNLGVLYQDNFNKPDIAREYLVKALSIYQQFNQQKDIRLVENYLARLPSARIVSAAVSATNPILRKASAELEVPCDHAYRILAVKAIQEKFVLGQSSNGNTALHWALSTNQLNKALILLEEIKKSKDRTLLEKAKQITNNKGETILEVYKNIATLAKSEDIVKLGEIFGDSAREVVFKPTISSSNQSLSTSGDVVSTTTFYNGHETLTGLQLNRGVPVNQATEHDDTLLEEALADLQLERDMPVNQAIEHGDTLLEEALANLQLDSDTPINQITENSDTLLRMNCELGHEASAQFATSTDAPLTQFATRPSTSPVRLGASDGPALAQFAANQGLFAKTVGSKKKTSALEEPEPTMPGGKVGCNCIVS